MRTFLVLLCSSFLVATVAHAEDPPPHRLEETSPSALVDTTRTRAHGDLRLAWGREADGRRVMCADVGPRDRACYRPGLRPRFVGSLEILAGVALAGGGTSMLMLGLLDAGHMCDSATGRPCDGRLSRPAEKAMMGLGVVGVLGGVVLVRFGIATRIRYREGLRWLRAHPTGLAVLPARDGGHGATVVVGSAF